VEVGDAETRVATLPGVERRSRLARLAVTVLAVIALGGVAAGCGATAGEGKTVPPSTSPK
jgi:hypothetical protein